MEKEQKNRLSAHLSLLGAACCWGLMSPLGKDAMQHGVDSITLVSFRLVGGAILFWVASLFVKHEPVPRKDIFRFALAAVFGLVCNQCCFTIGLGMTTPINAGIVTTTMPIFAMILAALILREPITIKKALGVALGCCGAFILILTNAGGAVGLGGGSLTGDLLCMAAQVSYALYLALFSKMAGRYSVITVNRWMFLWASVMILPFSAPHVAQVDLAVLSSTTWLEVFYVVCFGTFVSYLLMIRGQKALRPTVVSMYNYVQPVVAVLVSIALGLAVFTGAHALAIALIFCGVWLVTISRARQQSVEVKEEK